jgi:adenosine deaminase
MLNDSINRFLGVLCYPFTSLDYLHEDLLENYIKTKDRDYKKSKNIRENMRRNMIQHIRQKYSIYSYDEIYLYLEKCYLYKLDNMDNSFDCYYKVFSSLAKALISQRNGKLVFKYWENENDKNLLGGFAGNNKILLFNNFNRHIPLDIICIVYLLENKVEEIINLNNFYGQIVVSDLQLDNILSKGVAENHLHSGVSRSFLNIWESLMKPFTRKSIDDFNRLELSNNYGCSSSEFKFYILSSALIRANISVIVSGNNFRDSSELIQAFIDGKNIKLLFDKILKYKDQNEIYSYFISEWNLFLQKYNIDYNFEDNIIFNIFNEDNELKTSGENLFLFNTIKYIKNNWDNDICNVKKLLVQYLRVKNSLFNMIVQQKTVKGLDYFQIQHYAKNSMLNKVNNKSFWEVAMREQFQDNNLRKIEFRRSISEKFASFRQDVVDFLKSYHEILINDYCIKQGEEYVPYRSFPQVGLVYHLLKKEDSTAPNKCFVDGEIIEEKLQFAALKNQYKMQIDNLKKLRSENSELSKYIVGLDAASLENSTPVWVFSEIYELARDSSDEPLFTRNNLIDNFKSLCFTFHAGEDFRHILSGLRRIDEAVQHLKFHAGDRIGHGIALGISADSWKNHNSTIIIPRIEALENYLWAYNILSQNYGNLKTTILAYLEKRIYDLSKSIYDSTQGLTTSVLIDGYLELFRRKHDDACKNANRESFCEAVKSDKPMEWNSEKLFIARHCKNYLIKMNEPIHFAISEQDIDIIKELQRIVKANISKAGIVIEVNPSSNTAIGDMDTLNENHIYDVNNFRHDGDNILVCINSDDPSVFNTNVSNELAYIYYGLVDKNVSKEESLNWIEKLRVSGMDSSFIKRNESDEQILKKLEYLINGI